MSSFEITIVSRFPVCLSIKGKIRMRLTNGCPIIIKVSICTGSIRNSFAIYNIICIPNTCIFNRIGRDFLAGGNIGKRSSHPIPVVGQFDNRILFAGISELIVLKVFLELDGSHAVNYKVDAVEHMCSVDIADQRQRCCTAGNFHTSVDTGVDSGMIIRGRIFFRLWSI